MLKTLIAIILWSSIGANKLGHDQQMFVNVGGQFTIAVLNAVHERPQINGDKKALVCGPVREMYGIQRVEAALFQLDLINKDKNILPNVTLGMEIRDGCWNSAISLHQTLSFIRRYLSSEEELQGCSKSKEKRGTLVGVMGPASSTPAISVYNLLQLFNISQVGYSVTLDDFSDKRFYANFFRVVPPDVYQVKAIADLLRDNGWTYISLVYTDEVYGRNGMKMLKKVIANTEICLAYEEGISTNEPEEKYDRVILNLHSDEKVNVVVCFCEGLTVNRILGAMRRNNLTERFLLVGSDGWAGRRIVTRGYEHEAEGSVIIAIDAPYYPEFDRYYWSLTPQNNKRNPWFRQFWAKKFNCTEQLVDDGICPGDLRINYEQESKLSFVMLAVRVFAQALHNMIESLCGPRGYPCESFTRMHGAVFREYLKNVTLTSNDGWVTKFDENGDAPARYKILEYRQLENESFAYVPIGKWENGELTLRSTAMFKEYYKSACARRCKPGTRKEVPNPRKPCCWVCIDCKENEISKDELTCERCKLGTWPNKNRTACEQLTPHYVSLSDFEGYVPITFSIFGIIATLLTAYLFIRHNDTPVVKSSSRELSYAMLIGMIFAHSVSFAMVGKPNAFRCVLQRMLPGASFSLIYSCLLTKTNRMARILAISKKRFPNMKRKFMSTRAQIILSTLLTAIELAVCLAMLIREPANVMWFFHRDNDPQLVCDTTVEGTVVPLIFNAILVSLCTYYAIRTRNIPANFNEAKFIGFSMYATLITWFAFSLVYYGSNHKVITTCICVSSNALVILVFLFFPKLYIILIRPERNTRAHFVTAKGIRCHIIGANSNQAACQPQN